MDIRPPDTVRTILGRLWSAGHAGYVVGGSLRDVILGREPADWDLATDARPDRLLELFPGAVYENRFGTVAVRDGAELHEITTFRSDHDDRLLAATNLLGELFAGPWEHELVRGAEGPRPADEVG